jgi:hypothetical protein
VLKEKLRHKYRNKEGTEDDEEEPSLINYPPHRIE